MLGKSLFLVTILCALCSANLFDPANTYVYYYQSALRPPNGWHLHGGAYAVVNSTNYTNNAGSAQHCTVGVIKDVYNQSAASIAMTAPLQGMAWSKSQFCSAHCNFSEITVFVTHCYSSGSGSCPITGMIARDHIRISAMKNGTLFYNLTVSVSKYPNFKSFQCVNNFTSVYLNGDLVFTSNKTTDVTSAGVYFKAGGPVNYSIMKEFKVLAYFVNGTAQDVILCDNSPKGLLACQYNTGNFSDGFYPFTNSTLVREKFIVYRESSVNTTLALTNFTFTNVSNAQPNIGGVNTFHLYQTQTAQSGYYNFNLSFLSQFVYKASDFMYGSYHPSCSFRPETINSGLWFNSLSVSLAYGPLQGGCKQSVFSGRATCCYAYSYNGPIACKGVYAGELQTNFECGLLIYVTKSDGSRIQTRTEPLVLTQHNYNNITLDKCVDYSIYGRVGQGFITNVTDSAANFSYLADGGLAILDTSGAIDVFVVQGSYGLNYYKVNPCEDVNQQFVVSGRNIVGILTSRNETGSEQVENQFYVKLTNSSHRRRRSIGQNVTSCPYVSYGRFCIEPDGSLKMIVPEELKQFVAPLLNITESVLIPNSFNLTVTDEYIQTRMDKVQINCLQYVCGNSLECRKLFQQYGPVCDNILSVVNSVGQKEDMELLSFYSSTKPAGYNAPVFSNISTGDFNISLLLTQPSSPRGRSFIEDLLFTSVETVGLPTDAEYKKCTAGPLGTLKDLICAREYNGLLVLPPIITADMQTMYTASLVGAMAFGGITAAGAIPFATQIQARINHLGITQSLLLKNQEKIAASFNKAIGHMQEGFRSTSLALQQVQDVVNKQSAILTETMNSLNKNFGAISSVIQDIYAQLDAIQADAQVDRLITGRLSSLSVLASAKQSEYIRVSQQRELATQKINECVKSQSNRYGFCGSGRHVLSIPQNAPNGIVFIHFSYTPESFVNVTAIVGFCVQPANASQYAIVPVNGRGIFIQVNGSYYITARDMYMPRDITAGDIVTLTSCQTNYVNVNKTVITTFVEDDDFDFDDELSKWWNDTKHELPDFDDFNYTVPILNISGEIDHIQGVIQGLNDSLINLEELSILKTYIKWPWYVWLAIGFAIIIFILILGWVFFMTGCCGCCCGCFGIIPLMSKCGKKSSYYTTFDNDVVTEQYRPKKSV
uniref:Spike glycoprotein n=1 Tax=Avian coronavirus TaxID=694014 RepID=A0A7T7IGI4_9GAMC|nr:spike glycoprotein [Avian coronavirus]QQL06470.1 spike glycoprotein [Avian coronavirus]QQL06476.1 spike glycoprotein [Avian coronavirus]QQL06482.1 spike glycoprotein [Avian coronavirus]QQL06488.1 spike glycoprotein [Avian coronavirus]